MTVPVRQEPSINALVDKLYVCLRHEKSCTCGECSGGLNAVDELASYASALRVRADQAAEEARQHLAWGTKLHYEANVAEGRAARAVAEAESLRQALREYLDHLESNDGRRGHSHTSCPPLTRAMCKYHMRARAALAAADATQEPNAAAGGGRQ